MENSRATMGASSRNSGSGGSSGRFPLPANYFPAVACNDTQGAILQREVDKIVKETVRAERWEMHYEDSSRGWKLSSSKKHFRATGIRTYCRKSDAPTEKKKTKRMDFKCMGRVGMPLEQAMEALYSDNTVDFRHNTGTLLDGCLDALVLHVIKRRSDAYPHRYLGMNWVAMRSTGMFSKKRDVCYLKGTGTTFDADRNEVGYLVMRSLDVKECHSMESSHGLMRTNVSAILLLKENPDARSTTVIWQGTVPLSGSSSSKMIDYVHTNFSSMVANLSMFTVSQYLARETDLERFVSANRERKTCHLCNKKFSLLRSRHHCDSCGEMMCRDCEVVRKATPLDRETMAMHPSFAETNSVRRHCKRCMASARTKAESQYNKTTYDFTQSTYSVAESSASSPTAYEQNDQNGRVSAVSSTDSQSSLQLTWPDLSKPWTNNRRGYSASISSRHSSTGSTTTTPTFARNPKFQSTNLSTSNVPESPLTIKSNRTNPFPQGGRERLETDPWEHYDAFEQSNGPVDYEPETGKPSLGARMSEPEVPMVFFGRMSDPGVSQASERLSESTLPPFSASARVPDTVRPSFNGRSSETGRRVSETGRRVSETGRRGSETSKPSFNGRSSDTGKPSFYGRSSETGKPSFTGRASETGKPSFNGRGSMYSNDGHEMDLATRLWEMSRRAQETLDVTRRNSCMMSDTGSAPRSSEQFQFLDKSIAEQADLLNVIGFVSTGRVYMETGDDEHGEHVGVRISETSIDEEERFEILT